MQDEYYDVKFAPIAISKKA